MTWRPLNADRGSEPDSWRIEPFRLAAPVLRRHGYRGATIKALAHACHLSPALYHDFPSKAALASGLILDRAAPGLGAEGARELARRVLAMLVAPHATGLDPDPAAVRGRTIDLLRRHLASVGSTRNASTGR